MPYSTDDTIVAVSTPLGRAALGVIRLSGPRAVAIVDGIFQSPGQTFLSAAASHTLRHGHITGDGRVIDEVLVALMLGPHSYTGDDVVEISAHGGPVLIDRILRLCLSRGARNAERGEFTFRAFINGKMDLAQAEAVADLIESKTDLSAHAALSQLTGKLSEQIRTFRAVLIDLLSHLEVALDYAEEDIRFVSAGELLTSLQALQQQIVGLQRTADKGKLLREGVRATIIGKPNVGKSSLLNTLLERERAIVTDVPGTTRDVIEELLDVRGIPVVIMDTAGLRTHTTDAIERLGQERTRASLAAADLVLWVIDASQPLSAEDRYIAGLLKETGKGRSVIVLFNKCDRPAAFDTAAFNDIFPGHAPVLISALTRRGLENLEEAIVSLTDTAALPTDTPFVNARHRDTLDRTAQAINEALTALGTTATEEIIAFHIREALNTLGEITGETTTEEILQNIFSRFCVGK
jgi:tRNA modification GTPase